MTIAGVYVAPEGVVLGADSTSSYLGRNGYHFFDYGQKLFEIGQGSTLGLLTWGYGGLGPVSYRALSARLDDAIRENPAAEVSDVAERWIDLFLPEYQTFGPVQGIAVLHQKAAHDPQDPRTEQRTAEEEAQYRSLRRDLGVGFCIAGYTLPRRSPTAYQILFDPVAGRPSPVELPMGVRWWGMQNIMNRLIYGVDDNTVDAILASGHWQGTDDELVQILTSQPLVPEAYLPIRDAVDFVHSAIYCTIKAMKFSHLPQVCGGPVELAVITADRSFRWVRHKPWDAAINLGNAS